MNNVIIILKFKTANKPPLLQLFVSAVATYCSQSSIFFSPSCILHFTKSDFYERFSCIKYYHSLCTQTLQQMKQMPALMRFWSKTLTQGLLLMKYCLLYICFFLHSMQKYGKLKISDVLRMFTLFQGQFIGLLCI